MNLTAEEQAVRKDRVFLVVADDAPEAAVALRYASLRVRKSGGRVAILRVMEPVEGAEWGSIADMMRAEQRENAEQLLNGMGGQVIELTGVMPILIVREGNPRDELLALLAEDPRISILVLASSTDTSGPGPLITALAGRSSGKMRIPMTIVPGAMTDEDLDRVT